MIKVRLELDYPDMQTAMDSNPNLSSLINSSKCISFSSMEELPNVKEFMAKKNEKVAELYANMGINAENASEEMKKSIDLVASEWAHENYYYHYSSNLSSNLHET